MIRQVWQTYRPPASPIEASSIWRSTMASEQQDLETLDVCDLEYDVASVGAAEASAAEGKQPAYIIFYKLPERS